MGRILIFLGFSILLTGLFIQYGQKMGLGDLPGDFTYRTENTILKIPIVTCLILSGLLSLLAWIWRKFF